MKTPVLTIRNSCRFNRKPAWIYLLPILFILVLLAGKAWGQTTIASEGFETGGSTLFAVTTTGGTVAYNSTFARTGSYGLSYSSNGDYMATLTSSAISTSGYTNIQFSLRDRSGTDNALDIADYIKIYVSPDNGTNYYLRLWLRGDGTTMWTYTTGTATASADYSTSNISTYSHTISASNLYGTITISALPAVSQMRIKIEIGDRYGSTAEYWGIDDITITGTAACTPPTTQATLGTFSATGNTGTTVNWTRGSGTGGVIVVARLTSTAAVNPASGTSYTANATFGSGGTTGAGNFVVYKGTGTSVTVTGLTSATNYTFTVYEYNTTGTCYLIPGAPGVVSTTCSPPGTQASIGNYTNNTTGTSLTANWTPGNGSGRIVVAR